MNLLKIILSTSAFAIASVALHAQLPTKVESFPVRDVRLTASPFKHAEDMDIRYLLGIDPDRLLAPYLKEAGLFPKAENYTIAWSFDHNSIMGKYRTGRTYWRTLFVGPFLYVCRYRQSGDQGSFRLYDK